MLNVVVAVKLWSAEWTGLHIEIMCDNWACVCVLNNGRSRDPFLIACAREVSFLITQHDFTLTARHIQGCKNEVADALSRCSSVDGCPETVRQFLSAKQRRTVKEQHFQLEDYD